MPSLSRRTLVLWTGVLFFALVPPTALLLDEPYLTFLFSRILIYGLAAVSLDLIVGYGAMVSFGHAAFFGFGAYVVAILTFHSAEGTPLLSWPLHLDGTNSALIAWPLAVVATALLATLIGLVSLRTSGIHFIMITLAFAQMLFYFFVSLEVYGGDDGLNLWGRNTLAGLDLNNDATFYYLCLLLLVGFVYLCHRLVNSRFGMVIRGCKQNERRMQTLGFPTYRYKLVCFAIAGGGAGLAGALIANHTEFVSPGLLHWPLSGELLVMVILGGMGTLFGPIIGATTFLLMEEILAAYTEHWMVILGPLLILVVLFAKRGIFGLLVRRSTDDG